MQQGVHVHVSESVMRSWQSKRYAVATRALTEAAEE